MSNYLAIATVTATLQKMLQEEIGREMPGAQVTTLRPDAISSNISGACLNVYLYQATPNPAWRNADLRTRRPKADLIKHGQAGLDLHYLFTFYGEEQTYEPQRLMGCAIRALVDNPMLTEDMIQESVDHAGLAVLEGSTLMDQIQSVRLIPTTMTTEELSRIWSVFLQLPYSLSFPYQATAVLIQGEKAGQTSLPVMSRSTSISVIRPLISQIDQAAGNSLITIDSTIIVQGRQLAGKNMITEVQLGKTRVVPQEATDTSVKLSFSDLTDAEKLRLRAGSQGLQIIHLQAQPGEVSISDGRSFEKSVESNVMPFILCPTIQHSQRIHLQDLDFNEEDTLYRATVQIEIDLQVDPKQRAFLLLNSKSQSQTYIFRAAKRRVTTQQLSFPIWNVQASEYFLRVQVDGAVSPLLTDIIDNQKQYSGPLLVIS
ncbi:MAG: DUF4255 domain-containing protein [Cyanobacteria bacterium J06597_16]